MANTGLKQFLGGIQFINTVDSITYGVPSMTVNPRNPFNKGYPGLVNSSSYPSTVVYGKKIPTITISTVAKVSNGSWFTPTNINNLLFSLDSDGNTKNHTIILYDLSTIQYGPPAGNAPGGLSYVGHYGYGPGCDASHKGMRIFEGCRCTGMSMRQSAMGGPIGIDLGFKAIWGESEGPGVNTYTNAPPATDPGYLMDVASVAFGTSSAYIRSWGNSVIRGQGEQGYADQTYFANDIVSGMLSGSFTSEESPYGADLGTTQVIAFASGPTLTLYYEKDEDVQDFSIGLGNKMTARTLIKLAGGNPAAFA